MAYAKSDQLCAVHYICPSRADDHFNPSLLCHADASLDIRPLTGGILQFKKRSAISGYCLFYILQTAVFLHGTAAIYKQNPFSSRKLLQLFHRIHT